MADAATGLPPLTRREQRIVNVYLKCKIGEEGKVKRRLTLGDCFDAFALGKAMGAPAKKP